ncbi:MAG: hypothetical protein SFU86_08130 [Pirellulaceae bacterium]|nr:hypothetical protein [Pirellulaceae bacterium]
MNVSMIGGNAVGAWIEQVDDSAVPSTRDVDLAIRRNDLEGVKEALATVGFIYCHAKSIDTFLDGTDAKARDAVHIVFAGDKVREEDLAPVPDVAEFTSF